MAVTGPMVPGRRSARMASPSAIAKPASIGTTSSWRCCQVVSATSSRWPAIQSSRMSMPMAQVGATAAVASGSAVAAPATASAMSAGTSRERSSRIHDDDRVEREQAEERPVPVDDDAAADVLVEQHRGASFSVVRRSRSGEVGVRVDAAEPPIGRQVRRRRSSRGAGSARVDASST